MSIVLQLVLVTILFQTVLSQFQCFQCSSFNDDRCGDDFQPLVSRSPCDGTCFKYRAEYWANNGHVVEVNRVCGVQMREGCVDGSEYNGRTTRRCACNSNLCNSSKMVTSSLMVIMVTSVLKICLP